MGLWKFLYLPTKVSPTIRLYPEYINKKSEEAFYIKEKWDRESNRVLSKEEWHMACQAQWKTTSSLIWREFSWKTLVRFFITPLQKRHRTGSSLCWRRCQGTEAGHLHVFWSCPMLTDYWQNIHRTLEEVFRSTIPFRFDVLYLGNVPQTVRSTDRALMLTLLTASKKAITRKWLEPQPPSIENWIDIIHQIYTMEKLTYSLRLQQDRFSDIWSGWIRPLRQDFT